MDAVDFLKEFRTKRCKHAHSSSESSSLNVGISYQAISTINVAEMSHDEKQTKLTPIDENHYFGGQMKVYCGSELNSDKNEKLFFNEADQTIVISNETLTLNEENMDVHPSKMNYKNYFDVTKASFSNEHPVIKATNNQYINHYENLIQNEEYPKSANSACDMSFNNATANGGGDMASDSIDEENENERSKEDDEDSMVSIIDYEEDMDIEGIEVYSKEQDDNDSDVAVLKLLLTQKEESSTTKTGEKRKRKKFVYSKEERCAIKKQIAKLMHPVKKACSHTECLSSMSETRRKDINSEFWCFDYDAQCVFGYGSISRQDCRRRTKEEVTRTNTFTYFLHNDAGTLVNICKKFYLTTLGFKETNDSFIRMIAGRKNYLKPLPRIKMQGHHLKREPIDRTVMIAHINSFGPTISHYRREHAPLRLYLPSDITISKMYKDFTEKYPKMCSYDLYRKIVSDDMNISFALLGNEECEKCEKFKLHNPSHTKDNLVLNCSVCQEFKVHRVLYVESRKLYYSQKNKSTKDHIHVSKDLQKIMMLPRIDMFKEVMFCPRLSLLNECFVPIGKKGMRNYKPQPVALIWHEAIAGRNKEEFISCFLKFFLLNRDCKKFTIWLDNCGSQNKNWALYTFLLYIINSELIDAEAIELHYFQPGHTFMSADSFHHRIELALKQMKKVYDFNDFNEAVKSAGNGNAIIEKMNLEDFYNWPDCSSPTKRTQDVYMKDIVYVRAERGKNTLIYKTSYSSPEEFELNFLQVKYLKAGIPGPEVRNKYRGITRTRKDNIIQKCCSLMPDNRLEFWNNLPETLKESAVYNCDD